MNLSKIEIADYTHNPIIGCKHSCKYCYAKKINERFRFTEDFNIPEYDLDRLNFPKIKGVPLNRHRIAASISPDKPLIFLNSMSDYFGEWVDDDFIYKTFDAIKANPETNYMFITKNPKKALKFIFPENVFFGVTIEGDSPAKSKIRFSYLREVLAVRKFIMVEPLLGPHFPKTNDMSWVKGKGHFSIIGAMTGPNAIIPEKEWLQEIPDNPAVMKVFYKDNILKYIDYKKYVVY
jgi:protein gp37